MSGRQPYWCWLHQHPRSECGGAGGGCPLVDAEARVYREERAAGRHRTLFSVGRLRRQNEEGVTSSEIRRDIVESAKRDGREIESAKGYGG